MISNNNCIPARHGPDGHDTAACTKCAEYASEAQQWQSAYLQLERQFVKLQLRIDEVDTMSSLSRHGSMARSHTATATPTAPPASKPAVAAVQCLDQGVGHGSVCDLVNRTIQTSPEKAPATTDACVSTLAPPAVVDDAMQTDSNPSAFFTAYDDDGNLEEESPQSSELLTVIPPAESTALQSLSSSSSRSSSWISTTQSAVLTEDHASQTSCSFLATCASAADDEPTAQHVSRRKYRRRSSLARASDGSARPRPVSRRIRGLSKRPVKQRPLVAVRGDPELTDYSDVSDHGETSDDADVEPSVTVTSGSETESAARSVTPTQRPIGREDEEKEDDDDDESSSRGEPLEFASDSSMSQPRPPTPPLASKRTRYLQQQRQQKQPHTHPSVLATPPISPGDGAHSVTSSAATSSALTVAATSSASTRSIAPLSTNINNACTPHSTSSMSISISDSLMSMSDPPLVAVHGPVPESGSPLGMAAPRPGGATTDEDDEEDDDDEMERKQMPLDSAPTLLSLLESPAHSFNVLTVCRGGGAGSESAPQTLERGKGDEVPTLSRGTRLEIDLSRLSTITEMSGASVADAPAAAVAKSAAAGSGGTQQVHRQGPLPPMAWPKPPSTTPPPPATSDGPHAFTTSTGPMASTSAAAGPRATLVQLSPPLLAESSPAARKKSKSKKRSNASSSSSSASKLGALMPRRQATNTSTSSSSSSAAAVVPDSGLGGAHTVTSSEVSLSSTSCAADGHYQKEKNKGWKAVTSFVSKVKDKVRDKVHHKSSSSSSPSVGKNTVFVATNVQHHHTSPPTSRRASLAQLVGLGSSSHHHATGNTPLSPTSNSVRAVYGPFHHASPSASHATMASTVLAGDPESTGAPLSPRSVVSMSVPGGSSRGTPRPTGHATVGATSGAKMYQSAQQHVGAAAAYGSPAGGGGGASGAVVGRAPPHAGGSVFMSAATGGMVAAAAYASHLHQYQQQKQAHQQGVSTSATTNNLRPWLGPPPLAKSNSAPGSPHTAQATLPALAASTSRHMPQSMSVPELYSLAHAPTPRHTATASVPIMFPKPVKALGTPKVLLADPLEPSPNMRISMVTLESQPDSAASSRTPSPSCMSLKSDVPLITPQNAPPVPPLVVADPGMSLPRSLHLTDVDGEEEGKVESDSERPLQRTHRPGPPGKGTGGAPPPEVLTLDEVVDQIPVDVRSIASSRISLVMPAPSAGTGVAGGPANQHVHPAAAAAGSA